MKNCLVTGGAGFLGSHLVDQLAVAGHRVTVYDDFSGGNPENITRDDINFASILCEEDFRGAAVYHLAASVDISRSYVDPYPYIFQEVGLTLRVLEACAQYGADRIVFVSSSGVYDREDPSPFDEMFHTVAPRTPYAASKMMGETLMSLAHLAFGCPTISVRPFNIYGPRQRLTGIDRPLVPTFITSVLKNEPIVIQGDGQQALDFIYVKDTAHWLARLAEIDPGRLTGQAVNLGTGHNHTIENMALKIMDLIGKTVPIRYEPARKWYFTQTRASRMVMDNLVRIAFTSLGEGLRESIAYYTRLFEASHAPVEDCPLSGA